MKARCLLILHLLLIPLFSVFSQNICPNPGFEQISACPTGAGELNLASPWNGAGVPSDLFNFCHVNGAPPGCNDVNVPLNFAGTSTSHGGSSYAGFYTKRTTPNQRTYLQAPITPMTSSQLYRVSAFFRRSSASKFATNRIGISFSTAALAQVAGAYIAITPQLELPNIIGDTANWTAYDSYYTAVGGEAWITIGNFRSDANTTAFNFNTVVAPCADLNTAAFYYTDDISIIPVTEIISVSGDTSICAGETTTLTGITNTTGWWSLMTLPNDTIPAINNSITVSPVLNTTYLWNGLQSSVTVTVNVGTPPVVTLPPDTTVCQGSTVLLDAGNAGSEFLWSTGDDSQTILIADSGIYTVTVTNTFCAVEDSFQLDVLVSSDVFLPETALICPDNGEFVTLDAGTGMSYNWTPGADTTQQITVTTEGVYAVTVTHQNGCTKTGTTVVQEICSATLFFPGAFTPNEDGKNEKFYGDGTNFSDYSIKIFNRWGQLVFETRLPGIAGAWDGKLNDQPAPVGLYTYTVSYSTLKSTGKKKILKKKGSFALIR